MTKSRSFALECGRSWWPAPAANSVSRRKEWALRGLNHFLGEPIPAGEFQPPRCSRQGCQRSQDKDAAFYDSAIQRFNASMFSRLFGQMPVEKATLHDYVQPGMLEDRVYMRRPSFRPRLSATVLLIIANVVAFFVQSLLYASSSRFRIDDYLPLSLDGLKHGYLWQLLTFQFMHGGVFHLLFNCIAIF